MKKCSKCKKEIYLYEFYKCKGTKDGLRPECKICCKSYIKNWYIKNKNQHLKKCKGWRQENKEYKREYDKNYQLKNKITIKEKQAQYYNTNRKILLEKAKQYGKEHRKERNKYHVEWKNKDVQRRLSHNISSMMWKLLKRNKNNIHWEKLVDYTLDDLKQHLESKFDHWMNWNNYGIWELNKDKWHIDHIKPQSYFTFTSYKDKQFQECWTLNNLQPLKASINLSKGNRFIG